MNARPTVELIEVPLMENEYERFTTKDPQSLHETDLSMAINFAMVPISQ
jgi:hypothetical protein